MTAADDFSDFVADVEPRLRQALVAVSGAEGTRDAIADAFEYAWAHWKRVGVMENPAGYLYRIARNRLRHGTKAPIVFPVPEPGRLPDVDPRLPRALAQLRSDNGSQCFWWRVAIGPTPTLPPSSASPSRRSATTSTGASPG